jgi:hypothetical protein
MLTVLLTMGFIRDVSAFLADAIAALAVLTSGNSFLGKTESVPLFLYAVFKVQPTR